VHGSAIGNALLEHADEGLMLFGEWCAARHSLDYTRLPDWFLLFDVLETATGRFWSSTRRDALAAQLGLATTPQLASGRFTLAELTAKVDNWPSRFRDGPLEGIVVRRESAQWCERRAKLVRADFTQAIGEHWRHRRLEWNRLAIPTV
jgi:ATP-dependent RNA circularization protein (DNA/RNA ligase family)